MKNLLKKSAVAAAVAGSLMISGVASSDSLLAPLVIGINDGTQTYFSIKVRGTGATNARMSGMSDLHYVWFKKNLDSESGQAAVNALNVINRPCSVSNNTGRVSPWDMVLQRAVADRSNAGGAVIGGNGINFGQVNLLGAGWATVQGWDTLAAEDLSQPNGYTAGDFVGFVTITDKANVNPDPAVKNLVNEGDMSGFGYVVDVANSFVLDYKLLNNHRSKVEGDFSAGFIAKKSVDFSWMPVYIADTSWLVVATGEDMLKADSGAGRYDATVLLSQDALANSASPQDPTNGSGVYDNDEKVTSGAVNTRVTCMGMLYPDNIMSALQLADTVNGGWKRMSIQNSTTRVVDNNVGIPVTVPTTQVASGAIIYKTEVIDFRSTAVGGSTTPEALIARDKTKILPSALDVPGGVFARTAQGAQSDAEVYDVGLVPNIFPNRVVSFQVETSGHLSNTPEAHPNRPY
ncbi:MAG: hypothetical protein WAT29_08730 [Thiolinea sp.]